MKGLDKKVAIVSGGATHIGATIARKLSEAGVSVVIADNNPQGETVVKKDLNKGLFIHTDVSVDSDIENCVKKCIDHFGRLDFLINVAAVYIDQGIDSSRADWEKTFAINLFGSVMFLKHARPHIKDGGAVVNFGSSSAGIAQAGRWTYPASKAAILQLTRSAALDLAAEGIRVNAVSPAWTWSGILDQVSGGNRPLVNEVAKNFHMMKRIADPSEVADAVLFLCSDHANFITGTSLAVDGGYSALGPEQGLSPITELLAND